MKICSAKFDYLAWSDANSNSPEPPRYVVDLIYNAMDVPIPPQVQNENYNTRPVLSIRCILQVLISAVSYVHLA